MNSHMKCLKGLKCFSVNATLIRKYACEIKISTDEKAGRQEKNLGEQTEL